jgi:uncharacterized membrane protein YbhN (UPF0104 family)
VLKYFIIILLVLVVVLTSIDTTLLLINLISFDSFINIMAIVVTLLGVAVISTIYDTLSTQVIMKHSTWKYSKEKK